MAAYVFCLSPNLNQTKMSWFKNSNLDHWSITQIWYHPTTHYCGERTRRICTADSASRDSKSFVMSSLLVHSSSLDKSWPKKPVLTVKYLFEVRIVLSYETVVNSLFRKSLCCVDSHYWETQSNPTSDKCYFLQFNSFL